MAGVLMKGKHKDSGAAHPAAGPRCLAGGWLLLRVVA